ncbi:uncharacterized protein LOC128490447 isoform X2 [Spea bombifrons]|uniref:uncharacterized protein LOC128490447 isoform X2 n=1 Tax=Spea bombifrons TaxID=233779 RepID=UPI0023493DAA|nr:uncharacterized protein LOC128490447 isoform X2 [Spea bombifrons]
MTTKRQQKWPPEELRWLLEDLGFPVPSSPEELLDEVSHYLKSSSPDAATLIAPLKAASIDSCDTIANVKGGKKKKDKH